MDEATLKSLRAQLQEDREQHMELLDEHGADPYSDEVRNLNVGNDSFADSGQATEERSELLGQIDAARHRIHLLDRALEQMEDGTYGICESCGQEIQPERLEVRPLSVKCVDCAAKERG